MRGRGWRLAVFGVVGTMTACGGSGDGDAGSSVAPVWSLEVAHEIGSIEDVDQSLTWISDVVLGTNGETVVAQSSDGNVRVYGPDGELRTIVGRRGEGPEEIGRINKIGVADSQLWVLDSGNRRLLRFSTEGEFLEGRSWTPGSVQDGRASLSYGSPIAFRLLGDGSSMVYPGVSVIVPPGEEPPVSVRRPVVIVGPSGSIVDTVAVNDLTPRDEFDYNGLAPLSVYPIFDLAGDGDGVVMIERSVIGNPDPATFRVARVSLAGDTLFDRLYPYEPKPSPPGLADRHLAELREEIQQMFRDRVWVPENLPPISDLVVTQDGTIWLAREAEAQDSVAWWALDPDSGDHLGTIHLPAGHEIVAGQGDVLVAKRTDEFDVPYLVRYRVAR